MKTLCTLVALLGLSFAGCTEEPKPAAPKTPAATPGPADSDKIEETDPLGTDPAGKPADKVE